MNGICRWNCQGDTQLQPLCGASMLPLGAWAFEKKTPPVGHLLLNQWTMEWYLFFPTRSVKAGFPPLWRALLLGEGR